MMDTNYEFLAEQVRALAETDPNFISVMANTSAALMENLDRINWAGFYIVMDGKLKVGPFQGKTACILIEKGRGVCGTAWDKDETIVVPDVHEFPGHIACDSASRSEIVIPIHRYKGIDEESRDSSRAEVAAVLDIDSPQADRFDRHDAEGLEALVKVLEELISWQPLPVRAET